MAKCFRCKTEIGSGGVAQDDGTILCVPCDEYRHQPKQPMNEREKLAWLVAGICAFGLIAFAIGFFMVKPRVVEVPREITKTVEVPKEVVKTVEVPREVIRDVFKTVEKPVIDDDVYWRERISTMTLASKPLKKRSPFRLYLAIDKKLDGLVDKAKIQNKIELRLRSLGVPLDADGFSYLSMTLEGMWLKDNLVFTYSCESAALGRLVRVQRNADGLLDVEWLNVTLWSSGSFGYTGKAVLEKAVEDALIQQCEVFANQYLADNPKR